MVSALRIQTHHNFELLHHKEAMDGKKQTRGKKPPKEPVMAFWGCRGTGLHAKRLWGNKHLATLRMFPHRYSRQAETHGISVLPELGKETLSETWHGEGSLRCERCSLKELLKN